LFAHFFNAFQCMSEPPVSRAIVLVQFIHPLVDFGEWRAQFLLALVAMDLKMRHIYTGVGDAGDAGEAGSGGEIL